MVRNASTLKFEDFLHTSVNAKSPEELFDCLTKTVGELGFDKVIFSITHDWDLPTEKRKLGIFHNYPSEWHKYYQEQRYDLIDPVLKCAATYSRAFTWQELQERLDLSSKQHRFFRESEDAKLYSGIGVPMRGSRGQLSGIALASSEQKDGSYQNMDLITAYCNQFYTSYKRFFISQEKQERDKLVILTRKESEILHWIAASKTDEEIGQILNISKNTVDTHVRHIFQKMDVNNRVSAVVKGIILGLVTP